MLKKYLPYIFLLAAILLYVFIKKNQRGSSVSNQHTTQRIHTTVDPVVTTNDQNATEAELNRHPQRLIYSKHARCRMDCRHIDESEIKEILETGKINYSRIEEDSRGKTYPVEGLTHDNQHVRIVFAPKKNDLVVVTVIDMDTEWACSCN